jgi:hypothetical protein
MSVGCLVSAILGLNGSERQKTFSSPTAAVSSLFASIEEDNPRLLSATVGPQMYAVWSTGDPVRDSLDRERFLSDVRGAKLKTDETNPNRKILYLGDRGEPFPASLVRSGQGWRFDGAAGSEEIVRRRISRNELAVIDLCQQYLQAQLAYAASHAGRTVFARKIRSTPGFRNGLYWSAKNAEDESLEGPLFASAAYAELEPSGTPSPYFGYYFKILLRQGPDAAGGALDYQINGELVRGFALVAWPAEYGVTGKRTFLVNQRGDVYQKDLGVETPKVASAMTAFNPDHSWVKVLPDADGE